MSQRKTIHFQVPIALYERSLKAFPDYGERSSLLRKLLAMAIRIKQEEPTLVDKVEEEWTNSQK